MLTIISPSKSQNFNSYNNYNLCTNIEFPKEQQELLNICTKFSIKEIQELMSISEKLSILTYEKFQNFATNHPSPKPALFAYTGDVYKAINPDKYSLQDLEFANQHLRIISGLYGLLKPCDLIKSYRLEMSVKLKNVHGENLYDFWQKKITAKLNEKLSNTPYLINLASDEYSKVIDFNKLTGKVINIIFKENKKGKLQIIGLLAKNARGMMVDFIIANRINDPKYLKEFNNNNYQFREELSDQSNYVFVNG